MQNAVDNCHCNPYGDILFNIFFTRISDSLVP